jgi:hypothetical protein
MFVKKEKIAVTIDGQNTIFIRGKMPLGIRNKVRDELLRMDLDDNGQSTGQANITTGASQTALLAHNITGWSGPEFVGMPCNRVNIEQLDPDEPLVKLVLEKIAEYNPAPVADPNSTTDGEPSSTDGDESPAESSTPTSS